MLWGKKHAKRKANGQFNGSYPSGTPKSLLPTRRELRAQRKLEKVRSEQGSEMLAFEQVNPYPTLSELPKTRQRPILPMTLSVGKKTPPSDNPTRFASTGQFSGTSKVQEDLIAEERSFLENDILTIMDAGSPKEEIVHGQD